MCTVEPTLMARASAACTPNVSYGCYEHEDKIWVSRGCRSGFRCGGFPGGTGLCPAGNSWLRPAAAMAEAHGYSNCSCNRSGQSHWAPAIRLVYNRVDKTGSASLARILEMQQIRRVVSHMDYVTEGMDFPSRAEYAQALSRLPMRGVYVRHAHHLLSTDASYVWVNVVREPLARWRSQFEWQRSTRYRIATGHGASLEIDPCQSAGLKTLDACLLELNRSRGHRALRSSQIRMPSQLAYFCEPDVQCGRRYGCSEAAACTLDAALHALNRRYRLVGLTERFEQTIGLLEAMLPLFFRNASRWSSYHDHRTRSRSSGGDHDPRVQAAARDIAARIATNYADEMRFYNAAKQLFLLRVAHMSSWHAT